MLYYFHNDHLGTASLTTNSSGAVQHQSRQHPYGSERWTSGTDKSDYDYTGQRKEGFGLLDYNARYYSPALGRFISADALVPNPANPQAFNRYGYAYNNPIRYNDPTGHNPDPDPNNIFALPFEGGGGEQAGGGGVVVAFAALVYHLFVQPNLPPVNLPNPAPPRSAGIGESYPSGSGESASSLNNSSGGGQLSTGPAPSPLNEEQGPYTTGGHTTDSGQTLNDLVLASSDHLVDLTDFRRTHILNRHRAGAGIPGKTEFPATWSDDEIIHHISDVASDPNAVTGVGKWDSPYAIGVRDGIQIRVDFYPNFTPDGMPHPRAGMISTGYPTNVPSNP